MAGALQTVTAQRSGRRKLWTRDEAAKLTALFPHERYELIEGELISKMGQNPPHALVIAVLNEILSKAFSGRVRIQSSISLPGPDGIYSEPEPDVVLLHGNVRQFSDKHPGPADIALLIEVSDTTFDLDRSVKYRLYARTGIAEYWIVDVSRRRTVVCKRPSGEEYNLVQIVSANEDLLVQDQSFALESLLP
jgi:Uma2 family endonuclease